MNKISKILFVLGSALILIIPTLTTNIKPEQMSTFDNRALQEFPPLNDKNFRRSVERYTSDRVGLRNEMITAYQYYCAALFHKLVHPSYVYGKGGHIIAPWDLVSFQHLDVSEKYLTTYTDYIENLQKFCNQKNMDFLYVLIPNKETIYPEAFPDGYNVKDQPGRTELILDLLDKKSVEHTTPIDLFNSLKNDHLLYNVKYDAGHWNDTGAFYGHQMIIDHISEKYPEAGHLSLDEFDLTQTKAEYLAASYFRVNEMVPDYELKETDSVLCDEVFDQIAVSSPNQYHYYYKNEALARSGAPKVMIFGDSYLRYGYKFYLNHCSELVMLHAEFMPNAEYYISLFQPDFVIYETAERMLESDWDKFKADKKYYSFYKLPLRPAESGTPYAEQVILNADLDYLKHECEDHDYVSVSGSLNDLSENPTEIKTLIAVLNGKEYYPHFDKDNTSYTFTFRKEDIVSSRGFSFYAVKISE